jgi:hypothetical protein
MVDNYIEQQRNVRNDETPSEKTPAEKSVD